MFNNIEFDPEILKSTSSSIHKRNLEIGSASLNDYSLRLSLNVRLLYGKFSYEVLENNEISIAICHEINYFIKWQNNLDD
ncbi:hypothetical protein [Flagellimonas allohymeniacidonis]|uniref:Uncharacterized protein n=1 Tax=Flagellimonas allohymeniacidonis TaxID=2517819 RepID=A0A4Q8QHZ0_9FLAO|nr:hypothetical protein [Allomuricauda hymeniacidonis]TAI47796.1 hypothetical protein EW142_14150 [Allomuricauda hymeniacidonis]